MKIWHYEVERKVDFSDVANEVLGSGAELLYHIKIFHEEPDLSPRYFPWSMCTAPICSSFTLSPTHINRIGLYSFSRWCQLYQCFSTAIEWKHRIIIIERTNAYTVLCLSDNLDFPQHKIMCQWPSHHSVPSLVQIMAWRLWGLIYWRRSCLIFWRIYTSFDLNGF